MTTRRPYVEAPQRQNRYITEEARANPHPLYCVWEITLACDLGCKHCGSRAGPKRDGELTTAECLDVVAQLADMGVRLVTLIGGEAYMREDWDIIAAEIKRRGMVPSIVTGGRNFDADRVQRAVDAGVRTISVSFDGMQATHDAQRGVSGSWQSAVDTARRIADTPIQLATNSQINRLSMPELVGMADLLRELGSRAWQIQLTVPMGRSADRPQLPLQPYQLLELFPLLAWVKENVLKPHDIHLMPGNNIGYFGPYEDLLRYGGEQGTHWAGCPAGQWSIGVEADGKIKPCPSLPSDDWTGGYLPGDALADVVDTAPELVHLKGRTQDDLWGFCKTCYYADVCKGGCTWTAQCALGRPGNNPYCIHRAVEYEAQGKREVLVQAAHAPGRPFDYGRFDIRLEDLVEPTDASIGGIPLETVMGLRWNDPSVWTDDQIRAALSRIGRRLVQIGG
jgi:radical SAM protein with 4Fe4S-binding SPASM domain